MSITVTSQETYPCSREGCEQTRTKATSVDGSYCSQRCSDLATGKNLFKHIKHDHRFCHSCFRQLKEIERPPAHQSLVVGPVDHDTVGDTFRDVLVGYEHMTEHAEFGESSTTFVDHDDSQRPDGPNAVVTGTICTCGTTDHRDEYIREEHVTSVSDAALRLCNIIELLGREGQHDKTIHVQQFIDELAAGDSLDWEISIGRAVQS